MSTINSRDSKNMCTTLLSVSVQNFWRDEIHDDARITRLSKDTSWTRIRYTIEQFVRAITILWCAIYFVELLNAIDWSVIFITRSKYEVLFILYLKYRNHGDFFFAAFRCFDAWAHDLILDFLTLALVMIGSSASSGLWAMSQWFDSSDTLMIRPSSRLTSSIRISSSTTRGFQVVPIFWNYNTFESRRPPCRSITWVPVYELFNDERFACNSEWTSISRIDYSINLVIATRKYVTSFVFYCSDLLSSASKNTERLISRLTNGRAPRFHDGNDWPWLASVHVRRCGA